MSDLAEVGRLAIEDQEFYEDLMEDAGQALESRGIELSAEDRAKVEDLTSPDAAESHELMTKLDRYHATGAWDDKPWPVW